MLCAADVHCVAQGTTPTCVWGAHVAYPSRLGSAQGIRATGGEKLDVNGVGVRPHLLPLVPAPEKAVFLRTDPWHSPGTGLGVGQVRDDPPKHVLLASDHPQSPVTPTGRALSALLRTCGCRSEMC